MYLGKRVVSIFSPQKNINGKSSTEDELISVYDATANIIWLRQFIESQGYKIAHNRIMKYNRSDILLEKMASSPAPNGPITSRL